MGGRVATTELATAKFPDSLGLFYSAMTAFLGFKPMNDECTTMALAAFGRPIYAPDLRALVNLTDDGLWRLEKGYFAFDRYLDAPWTERLVALLGPPRAAGGQALGLSAFRDGERVRADDQHWADIAASVQAVLEAV